MVERSEVETQDDMVGQSTVTETIVTPAPTTESAAGHHPVYDGCDVSKTCYGLVSGCEDYNDCDVLATWRVRPQVTTVELFSRRSANNRYAAMALSNDDKMGEDTVIGCVSAGGKVEALLSWNDGRNNVPMIEKFGNVELLNGSNVDGGKVEGEVAFQ